MKRPRAADEAVSDSARTAHPFASLALPQYRQLWAGTFLTFAAGQMTMVARPWLAFELTGQAFDLGLVAMAQGLPMFFLAPLGGVAADRLSKRTVLLLSQAMLLVMASLIVASVYFEVVQVWHLAIMAIAHGVAMPFNMPVRQSYVPVLLPRRLVPNGVALQAAGRNMNQVAAPSAAGFLLAFDPVTAFAVIAGLHVLSMLMSLTFPKAAPPADQKSRGVRGELFLGFRYVLTTPLLRLLFGMLLLTLVLGMPYMQLLPVFQEVLEVGPSQLGLMYAAVGTGGLLGSLAVAWFSTLARGSAQFVAGAAFGLSLVGFALSPGYLIALALLVAAGFANQAYNTINQTLIVTRTDQALYGRVMSINMMMRSFITMSILPMGFLADQFGAPATIAVSASLLTLSFALIALVRGVSVPEGEQRLPPG